MKKFMMLLAVCGFLVSCATSGGPEAEQIPGSELTLNPEPSFVEESPAESHVSDQVAANNGGEVTSTPTVMPTDAPLPDLVHASEPAPVSTFTGGYTPPTEEPSMSSRSDVGRYGKKSKSDRKISKKIAKKASSKKIAKKSKDSFKKSKLAKNSKADKKLSKAQCKKIAKHMKKSSKKEIAMCKLDKKKSGKHVARR